MTMTHDMNKGISGFFKKEDFVLTLFKDWVVSTRISSEVWQSLNAVLFKGIWVLEYDVLLFIDEVTLIEPYFMFNMLLA